MEAPAGGNEEVTRREKGHLRRNIDQREPGNDQTILVN